MRDILQNGGRWANAKYLGSRGAGIPFGGADGVGEKGEASKRREGERGA